MTTEDVHNLEVTAEDVSDFTSTSDNDFAVTTIDFITPDNVYHIFSLVYRTLQKLH